MLLGSAGLGDISVHRQDQHLSVEFNGGASLLDQDDGPVRAHPSVGGGGQASGLGLHVSKSRNKLRLVVRVD